MKAGAIQDAPSLLMNPLFLPNQCLAEIDTLKGQMRTATANSA